MTAWLRLAAGVAVVAGGAFAACGREPVAVGQAEAFARTVRTPWGEPNLTGVWQGPKRGAAAGQDSFNLARLERLYRPEARARMAKMSANDDPARHCVPQPFPRAAALGWPIQIVQRAGMLLVLTEAFHTFRYISTDGRGHAGSDYQFPTYVGHAAGKWDGDVLVVDVVRFREPWLAGGPDRPTPASTGVWPTSDTLHVVERWRRVDADTLEYQARVDDPSMLTAAWETPTIALKRQPVSAIQEVKCLVDDADTPPATYLAQFGR
jgi:hypothetical protein